MDTSPAKHWIGLVEVRPRVGVEVFETDLDPNNIGAFATVVVLALSQADARIKLQDNLNFLGLDLIDFTEIEQLSERTKKYSVEPDVLTLAAQLDETNPVGLDEFSVFPLDED